MDFFFLFFFFIFCKKLLWGLLGILNVLSGEKEVSFKCEPSGFFVKILSCFFYNETRQACKEKNYVMCVRTVLGGKEGLGSWGSWVVRRNLAYQNSFTLEHGQLLTVVAGYYYYENRDRSRARCIVGGEAGSPWGKHSKIRAEWCSSERLSYCEPLCSCLSYVSGHHGRWVH